jgi:hypothetical protein
MIIFEEISLFAASNYGCGRWSVEFAVSAFKIVGSKYI